MATLNIAPRIDLLANERGRSVVNDVPSSNWVHVLPHLDPIYGGLSAVVPRLASRLYSQQRVKVRLAAFCSADEVVPPQRQEDADRSLWPLSRSAWAFNSALRRQFRSMVSSADGVHIHGLWESSTYIAASAARKAGVPYVISAHGMLEPWALANKRLKKAVYAAVIEHGTVNGAACLHALTQAEAMDCRNFGYDGPIAVIPNGVEASSTADATLFLNRYPKAQGKRLLLFLGRIHYKKGVDLLVNAWGEISTLYPDTLLVLAGPDSEGTLAQVQTTMTRLGLEDRVLITGMLDASMKWNALAAASYFVLPSFSEGLSVAALEAMSMGVPLIVSDQCNLPDVANSGAGWQVKTTLPSLVETLKTALGMSTVQQHVQRENAANLARREFSWNSVTERMAELYRWVAGGPTPRTFDLQRGDA